MKPIRIRVLRTNADTAKSELLSKALEEQEQAITCFPGDPDPSLMRGIHKVIYLWSNDSNSNARFHQEAGKWSDQSDVKKYLIKFEDANVPEYITEECEQVHTYTNDTNMLSWLDQIVSSEPYKITREVTVRNFLEALTHYKKSATERLRQLDVVGEEEEQDIDKFFVDVFLIDENGAEHLLKDRALKLKRAKIFIEGVAGSGKSTLLKHLAFRLASGEIEGSYLPLFVSASELVNSGFDSLDRFLRLTIKGACDTSAKTTSELLMDGDNFPAKDAILFIDGVDEISQQKRREIKQMISLFEAEHPDIRIIVSSRPNGWDPDIWEDFERLFVKPLAWSEIETYVSRHCTEGCKEELKRLIFSSPQIAELAGVPFLLALIVAYAGEAIDLPTERAKLIKQCVISLISRRRRSKQGYIDDEKVMECMGFVSLRLFRLDPTGPHGEREFTFAIEDYLNGADLIELRKRDVRDEAELLLSNLIEKTGLLQFDSGELAFVHRSIWEFFVGLQLSIEEISAIKAIANTSLWEEPIRLMVGLSDDDKFKELITEIWSVNPGLALRSLTESSQDSSIVVNPLIQCTDPNELAELVRNMAENLPQTTGRERAELACVDTLKVLISTTNDAEIVVESIFLLSQLKIQLSAAREIIGELLNISNAQERLAELKKTMNFIEVTEGEFFMGNDSPDRTVDEKPSHLVTLSKFNISDIPLQNMHRDTYPFKLGYVDDPRSCSKEHPVIGVTWYEACLVALWFGCRLPTEAEWEFACRSRGLDDELLFDETKIPEFAWYADNAENCTHPPRGKQPNSIGIHDMMGNVREWCWDWFGQEYYTECAEGVTDPTGPETGEKRVLRGGCFDWHTANLVPSYRNSNLPNTRGFQNGVRLVEGWPEAISICLEKVNSRGDE